MLDRLAALAGAATPGPWFTTDWNEDNGPNCTTICSHKPEVLHPGQSSIWPGGIAKTKVADTDDGGNPLPDAAFIAACDPTTILALVEVAKAAKAWGDADTGSELILCNAILALQKIAQPEPGQP